MTATLLLPGFVNSHFHRSSTRASRAHRSDPLEESRKLEGIVHCPSGSREIIAKADLTATVSREGVNALQISCDAIGTELP
ncbi:MAG: hypothetical protein WCJ67_00570 [Thermoleophilia bacterium]